ncbi:putative Cytochrome [Streptomyces viridochromogenes Tue57]|uniref:Putative Cytochrome n=1 Tax=Streptomyces viridochromogenes Tue57 TaxID=1160705 RepID=L8PJX6_STRVR|nr:putative Cytochrome [Streptomyces viridochromogenes Tue57]
MRSRKIGKRLPASDPGLLQLAVEHELPALVHTPHRDKAAGTRRTPGRRTGVGHRPGTRRPRPPQRAHRRHGPRQRLPGRVLDPPEDQDERGPHGRVHRPRNLDVGRDAGGHLAFGHGLHQCLGQSPARTELRLGLPTLFRRLPALRMTAPPESPALATSTVHGVRSLPVAWR